MIGFSSQLEAEIANTIPSLRVILPKPKGVDGKSLNPSSGSSSFVNIEE